MGYIAGKDTIRGTDGMVCLVHPNGDREDLIQIVNLEATATINQDEVPRIGTRTIGHKVSTITFEGTATAYYGSPTLRQIFLDYLQKGSYPNLAIILENYDHDTQAKSQVMTLNNVVFTTQCIAKIDAESTSLQEDLEFTFENPVITDYNDDGSSGFDKTMPVTDSAQWLGEELPWTKSGGVE